MASSKFVLVVTTNNDAGTTAGEIAPSTSVPGQPNTPGIGSGNAIRNIARFLEGEVNGRGINVVYFDTAVSASTTGTFTGAPTAADTITVNGVVFTARASGAVANEFNIGGSVTANAANLAAAINASTTAGIINTVGATSALGVVTFYAIVPGSAGKNIPITESLGNFTLAATTFTTGGTQAHNAVLSSGL
jgi:hypothetical protein